MISTDKVTVMKKNIVSVVVLFGFMMVVTSCAERQSTMNIGEKVQIEQDSSLYSVNIDESEEKKAARECMDYISGSNNKETDYYKAAEIIKPYENSIDPDVLYCLGMMHDGARGLPYDYELPLKELKEAEAGGNYYASVYLGILYEQGTPNIDRDYVIARDYYRRAILNGVIEGYLGLGNLYSQGHGMEKDVAKGIEYYNKVINEGKDMYYITSAQRSIANLYFTGNKRDSASDDDDPEYDKAFELYEKSKNMGDLASMYMLGQMYIHGLGVEKDVDKGIELYETAANAGYVPAMRYLGQIYADGDIAEKDKEKSMAWFEKAVALNDPDAYFTLGQIYDAGIFGDADHDVAQDYYDKAYAAGYED